MKKIFATLLAALALLGMFALFVAAQEDEPLTWQEQYWQIYWQVMATTHTIELDPRLQEWYLQHPEEFKITMPQILLWDINNDGVLELIVHRGTRLFLLATIRDEQLIYHIERDANAFHIMHHIETGQTHIFRYQLWPHSFCEILVNWNNLSITSRPIHYEHWVNQGVFRSYTIRTFSGVQMGRREFNRLRNHFYHNMIELPFSNSRYVVGQTYDEVRANFFALLDEMTLDGSLYVLPTEELFFATEFLTIEVPNNSWRWLAVFWKRNGWLALILWAVVPVLIQWPIDRRRKRKEQQKLQQAPLTAIVSVDRNWAIGHENQLLFQLPGDMVHFRHTTMGHVVLMGRKTYDSLPKKTAETTMAWRKNTPLPDRIIVVITRDEDFKAPRGVHVCHSLDNAVTKAKSLGKVFVIGGGQIYNALLPYCEKAIVTQVDAEAEQADTYLLNLDLQPEWQCTKTSVWREYEGIKWRISEYSRLPSGLE